MTSCLVACCTVIWFLRCYSRLVRLLKVNAPPSPAVGQTRRRPCGALTLRNTGTNVSFRAETNAQGLYYLPAQPPGEHELTVEHYAQGRLRS